MRPGREMDTRIAREVFGHEVWATNKTIFEKAPLGKRPLRNYSKEIEYAFEVATKLKITLLPIEGDAWFAFVGTTTGWKSPEEFAAFLEAKNFEGCGAAVGTNPAQVICESALRAIDNRRSREESLAPEANPQNPETNPPLAEVVSLRSEEEMVH